MRGEKLKDNKLFFFSSIDTILPGSESHDEHDSAERRRPLKHQMTEHVERGILIGEPKVEVVADAVHCEHDHDADGA